MNNILRKVFSFIRRIFGVGLLQPILTVILVSLLAALIFQFVNGRNSSGDDTTYRQITRKVTFDDAVNKFNSGIYEINTKGSLVIKDGQNQSTPTNQSIKPGESSNVVKATENKFNDMFFFLDKGVVKKLDFKTYGQNESIYVNQKNEIVYLSNSRKEYSTYPIPDESDKKSVVIYESTKKLFNDLLPLIPLLKDYKDNKFYPTERATNIYSGKWQHDLFTSGEVVDVILETEPTSGTFRSISIVHSFTQYTSQIYFDFIPRESLADIEKIPDGYKSIAVSADYKVKK